MPDGTTSPRLLVLRMFSILARKLYAAFEVLPGKVTLLNPQISPDLHEPDLTFIEVQKGRSNPSGWYVYKQPMIAHRLIGQRYLRASRVPE
ncbi:class I adenylate cyclase [Vibrio sp. PP-XX7]